MTNEKVTDKPLRNDERGMENRAYLLLINDGVTAFNAWRKQNLTAELGLIHANFKGTNLSGVNLKEADLKGGDFRNADLIGADISDANLSGAKLSDANLTDALLRGANLRNTNFGGATLSNADLREVDFTGSNLRGANLKGAKLRDVNLDGVALWAADFGDADISGADLTNALGLTQDQIHAAYINLGFPPKLPKGLNLPKLEDTLEDNAPTEQAASEKREKMKVSPFNAEFSNAFGRGEEENIWVEKSSVLRAHPKDRIITSGQLNTPTAQQRREISEFELVQLRDLLERCVPGPESTDERENVLRVPLEQGTLDLLQSIVKTTIELHKAPSYPQGLIDALLGLGTALRFFKTSTDWAPLPKPMKDKTGNAVAAYDGFLAELGLI